MSEEMVYVLPGVGLCKGELCLCPGCGMPAIGERPDDAEHIAAWVRAVCSLLHKLGYQFKMRGTPESLAAAYLLFPWHYEPGVN